MGEARGFFGGRPPVAPDGVAWEPAAGVQSVGDPAGEALALESALPTVGAQRRAAQIGPIDDVLQPVRDLLDASGLP